MIDLVFWRFGVLFVLVGCAAVPKDVLDGSGHDVRADASVRPAGAYVYAAKRPLVAVGLADAQGVSDDDAHRVVDALAVSASKCFARTQTLAQGAARITVPIDDGGITGAPQVTFEPTEATPIGMLCVLAPLRLSTFAPSKIDRGTRSITIESAWGP